jgi:adenosylcobinamide-GDP ribazoletransferase
MLRQEFLIFLAAVAFFTRIPCSNQVVYSKEYLAKSSRYLPLIGWIVGAVGALVIWIGTVFLPLPLTVLLSMTATILITGAFHEDGFMDVCDAFGGGWTKEQILTIMKDSCVGVFGVIGVVMLLGVKFFSLMALPVRLLPVILIAGHSLSRFVSISLLYTHDYVREDSSSKSKPLVHRITSGEFFIATFFGVMPLILLSLLLNSPPLVDSPPPNLPHQGGGITDSPPLVGGVRGGGLWIPIVCLITIGLTRWYLGRYFTRRIGGYTGDCLGAMQQITEVVFYLTLASFL